MGMWGRGRPAWGRQRIVDRTAVERVAAADSQEGQASAAEQAEGEDRLAGILRAGGLKAAASRLEAAQAELVSADEADGKGGCQGGCGHEALQAQLGRGQTFLIIPAVRFGGRGHAHRQARPACGLSGGAALGSAPARPAAVPRRSVDTPLEAGVWRDSGRRLWGCSVWRRRTRPGARYRVEARQPRRRTGGWRRVGHAGACSPSGHGCASVSASRVGAGEAVWGPGYR